MTLDFSLLFSQYCCKLCLQSFHLEKFSEHIQIQKDFEMDVVLEILCLSCHISTYKLKICNRIHISLNNILKIYLCPWQYFVCFSFGFFPSYLLARKENIDKKRILPNVLQHVSQHAHMDITHLHLLLSIALDMIRISILHLTYFYFIATPTVGSQNLLVINYSRVKRNLDLALSGCVIGLFYLYHVGSYYNLLWAIEKKFK